MKSMPRNVRQKNYLLTDVPTSIIDTSADDLEFISKEALKTTSSIPFRKVITSFCGLRAHEDSGDFIIGEAEDAPCFFNATGIESPGLSASLAIGEMIASLVSEKLKLEKKENPILEREAA